jgi:citrate lyase subunit beta/citryl-CoA lyase
MPAHGARQQEIRMKLRSLLFVPGDRPERMEKAAGYGADALILDLEDSVAASNKPAARKTIAEYLTTAPRIGPLFVRINPLQSGFADADLEAVIAAAPDGIMLPKTEGAASLAELDRRLTRLGDRKTLILALTAETPAAMFQLGSLAAGAPRLCALTWGAEDLPAAIGAATARNTDGSYTAPYELARSMTLFAGHAAGVAVLETVFPNIKNLDALAAYAALGRRDGFSGMLAIHPSQIPVINAAFTPTQPEIAHAQAVVDAFAANPTAGVLQLDGKMIDYPHLKHAQRILSQI